MKKKILLSLLALFICNMMAWADVTWSYDSSSDTLTISGSGAMTNFTNDVRAPWEDYQSAITSIDIASGVTHIGSSASFSGWGNSADRIIPRRNRESHTTK